MIKKEIDSLSPNQKVFAWANVEEGAVQVVILKQECLDEDFYVVKRVDKKPNSWITNSVPACNVFLTESDCEKHCLNEQEIFETFCGKFEKLDDYLTYILINCLLGRSMKMSEYAAAVRRASLILGYDLSKDIKTNIDTCSEFMDKYNDDEDDEDFI